MKKVKLHHHRLTSIVETYDEINKSDELTDFQSGYLNGMRYILLALFGWTIGYEDDSVIRIRNRKGKVIWSE